MNTTLHPQPAVAHASSDVGSRPPFDSFRIVELIAHELQAFVCSLIAALFLAPVLLLNLSSLIVIFSNGEIDGIDVVYWELSVAVTVVLFGYGLLIGTKRKPGRYNRMLVQCMFWAIPVSCLYAVGFWSALFCVGKMVADAGLMAFGAVIGSRIANFSFVKLCGRLSTNLFRFEYSKRGVCRWALAIIFTSIPGAALLLVLFVGACIGSQYLQNHAEQVRWVGKPAPAATLTTPDGQTWSLQEHRGKVVLLEHCEPARETSNAAFPHLKNIHEKFRDHEDFVMASVSWGDKESSVDWFDGQEAGWELLSPGDNWEAGFLPKSIPRAPTAYLIDRDGTVTRVYSAIYSICDHAPKISLEGAAPVEKRRCEKIEKDLELLLSQ